MINHFSVDVNLGMNEWFRLCRNPRVNLSAVELFILKTEINLLRKFLFPSWLSFEKVSEKRQVKGKADVYFYTTICCLQFSASKLFSRTKSKFNISRIFSTTFSLEIQEVPFNELN